MKYFVLFYLLAFNSAFADVCTEGPEKALQYRAQSAAQPDTTFAGAFEVPVSTLNGQTFYESFERTAHERINITIDATRKLLRGIKYLCTDHSFAIRQSLRAMRVEQTEQSKISLKVSQLPTVLSDFFEDRDPSLLDRTKVEVIVNTDSILHRVADLDTIYYNQLDKWAEDKNHVSLLGKRFTQNLKEEFLSPTTDGSITLNMDNQYDLMCDFLTGNASFKITVAAEAPSNKFFIDPYSDSSVKDEHIDRVLEGLKDSVENPSLSKKAYFQAGSVWKDLVEQREIWSLENSEKAFNVVEGLFDTGLNRVGDREVSCLAENNSEIVSEDATHIFEINVTSQETWEIKESE